MRGSYYLQFKTFLISKKKYFMLTCFESKRALNNLCQPIYRLDIILYRWYVINYNGCNCFEFFILVFKKYVTDDTHCVIFLKVITLEIGF